MAISDIEKYFNDAELEESKNNYDNALKLYHTALNISEKFYGAETLDGAFINNKIGNLYSVTKEYKKALNYQKKSLQIMNNITDKHNELLMDIYYGIGIILNATENFNDAKKYFEAALALNDMYCDSSKDKKKANAVYFLGLGNAYHGLKLYKKAISYLNDALKIFELIEGNESMIVATTCKYMGRTYLLLGCLDQAIVVYNRAILISKKLLGNNNDVLLPLYRGLSLAYDSPSDLKEKKQIDVLLLEKSIEEFGENSEDVALSYMSMSNNELSNNNLKMALEYNTKVLNTVIKEYGKVSKEVAIVYGHRGLINYRIGDYKSSIEYYNKSIDISIRTDNSLDVLSASYTGAGAVYLHVNDINKAEACYEKALTSGIDFFDEESIHMVSKYKGLATISIANKEYEKAFKLLFKAINIIEKGGEKNDYKKGEIFGLLSAIYMAQNNYESALNMLKMAENLYLSSFPDSRDLVNIYIMMGIVFEEKSNYANSYLYSLKAKKHSTYIQRISFAGLDAQQKQIYLKNIIGSNKSFYRVSYQYILDLYRNKDDTTILRVIEQTYIVWLQEKGAFQDEETFLSIIYANTKDKALKEKIEELKGLKYQYAKLLNDMSDAEEENQRLELLKEKISTLEQYLWEHIQKFKQETEFYSITHQDIAKDLKEDELFIDFAEGEENYYYFTLNKEGSLNFKEISREDTRTIKEQIRNFQENTREVQELLEDFKAEPQNLSVDRDFQKSQEEAKAILSALYEILINNYLKKEIENCNRLTISPDGLLNLLPFDTLYDGEEYLLNKIDIYYISSGRELVRINRFGINEQTAKENITVFADPDYEYDGKDQLQKQVGDDDFGSQRGSRAVSKFDRVKPLKGTKEEAESIQRIFEEESRLYTKIEANEEHLREQDDSYILHIATHGIVVKNNEEKEPLLKTALALTGYNTSIKKKQDYGILTGLKIASFNLNKTQLVVLSACETAIGNSDNVIGVSSLSRAFMIAGAKSTIASFWEVEDKGTKEFFEHFYQKAKTQTNYAEVFKQTQREMYQKNKTHKDHPLFWAGFAFFGSV